MDATNVLSQEAFEFVAKLQRRFGATRESLLQERKIKQQKVRNGWRPDFLRETEEIRKASWKISPVPADLQDRRVEITGPVDRKMIINALNSGANVYMADFEDSHSPTWKGTLDGQVNLYDAVRRTIQFKSPEGKEYKLVKNPAVLMVRPRGWHLLEKHFPVDGKPVSASLFDFGLFFHINAKELIRRGTGPYFYLPKMESHLEARLWNEVFDYSESELSLPRGTIKATVLIETIMAAFEMDEILYELREHSAGLNCGRWDYIFSFIKKFSDFSEFVLPDRALVTMNVHFLKSYSQQLIKTCHRRGAHAMGGMAAQIPIKNNPELNAAAIAKVIADKEREVNAGHDGTWVAHPALVPEAKKVFDSKMETPNQLHVLREDVQVTASDLLAVPPGPITEGGLRTNVNVALLYLESWLSGQGCVPLYNLMEDAATAEISRAQVWQWIRHGKFSLDHFDKILAEEKNRIRSDVGDLVYQNGKFEIASNLLQSIIENRDFVEFITLPAYELLD